jgi:ribosomal protein S18 acetylase RimI-like enzyme
MYGQGTVLAPDETMLPNLPGSFSERSTGMRIAFAEPEDLDYLAREDHHVQRGVIEQKIGRREIMVLHHDGRRAGALRYGYFWDEIPFMSLLWVREELRGRGFGTSLVAFWEDEMRKAGYEVVMTSTLSSERAQHLYRRLGYEDCGCLLLTDEPLEIILSKKLA